MLVLNVKGNGNGQKNSYQQTLILVICFRSPTFTFFGNSLFQKFDINKVKKKTERKEYLPHLNLAIFTNGVLIQVPIILKHKIRKNHTKEFCDLIPFSVSIDNSYYSISWEIFFN